MQRFCALEPEPPAIERLGEAVRVGCPLTFVSIPSATSDIELSRVEGYTARERSPRSLSPDLAEYRFLNPRGPEAQTSQAREYSDSLLRAA